MTILIGGPVSGPVNAETDDRGKRTYTWQGRKLLSVTSAPRAAGMAQGLHRWFVGNLIDHVIDHANEIALRTATADEREVKALRAELWKATDGDGRKRILGVAVHQAASAGTSLEAAHPDVAPLLQQYLDWREAAEAEVLASEFQVWNLTVGYAGTVDLLVRLADGSIALVDLKTGDKLYAEMALQLTAYLMAEFVGANDVVDERLTQLLHQTSRIGILHLSATGWEYIGLRPDPETWTAYRALLYYVTWLGRHDKLDPLIDVRRRSDGVIWPSAGEPLSGLGWYWARIGSNVAHFVPPEGDIAFCFRAVERGRRTQLETQPANACSRCVARLAVAA